MKTAFVCAGITLVLGSCATTPARAKAVVETETRTSVPSFEVGIVLLDVPAAALARWIDPGDVHQSVVSASTADELVAAARRDGEIHSRPNVPVIDGGLAKIADTIDVEYVKDFDADGKPMIGTT